MKLVVGLGNPGPEYEQTRHNVGFAVVSFFAAQHGITLRRRKFDGIYGEGRFDAESVGVCLPQTYMNLSGHCVAAFSRFFRLSPAELLVVHDDLDLELGQLKFAHDRGAAGHRGVTSIIESLGTRAFDRLRVGIGRPPKGADPAEYVLHPLGKDAQVAARSVIERAAEAIECYLREGLTAAMERFHPTPKAG